MRFTFLVVSLTLLVTELPGQWMIAMNEDSLKTALKNEKDTTAVRLLLQLAGSYFFKQPATSLAYANAAIDSSRGLNHEIGIIEGSVHAGEASRVTGDLIGALKRQYEANQLSSKAGNKNWEANSAGGLGMVYFELRHFETALTFVKRAVALRKTLPPDAHEALYSVYAARSYLQGKEYDSAFYCLKDAARYLRLESTVRWKMGYHIALGDYYDAIGKEDSALFYWRAALKIADNPQYIVPNHVSLAAAKLSSVFSLKSQLDSSLYFARRGFKVAMAGNFKPRILDTSRLLADIYRKVGNADSALYYQEIAIAVNDSIFGSDKVVELQLLQLEEQKRNIEIQQTEERYQNNIRLISLISITAIILVASVLLFRSNRIKQKTNQVLHQTLNELKATQSQLVQSEKMASLGELTAGIAHEIQNPLNFVNNFAEINKELIAEMGMAIQTKNFDDVQEIAKSIADNHEKIDHHGKRADAIVKSMLQHSRNSSGQKELTDINALCDEYIRLTYHGFRAKDKSFNTKIETNFDPGIPKLQVIPQDIGRVILNLLNNAFYAVNEKSKRTDGYVPCVILSTKKGNNKIEIKVEDNGSGIANAIKEKIFQPFFTTKPTGQGTGLGLSMSYDIIKAHGGILSAHSTEGMGSEFIIQMPV